VVEVVAVRLVVVDVDIVEVLEVVVEVLVRCGR
jgi:hypothetical protein